MRREVFRREKIKIARRDKNGNRIFDIVYKCTDVVVSIVTTTVKAVTNGIKSIYDYAVNTVIPKAVEKTKSICNTVKTKFRNIIAKFAPAR